MLTFFLVCTDETYTAAHVQKVRFARDHKLANEIKEQTFKIRNWKL